jgi:aerobic-type carbon monoxide dehydrogenase small subunit (CoxS/CutS family)
MTNLQFWVNGKEKTVEINEGEMLSDVLRYIISDRHKSKLQRIGMWRLYRSS